MSYGAHSRALERLATHMNTEICIEIAIVNIVADFILRHPMLSNDNTSHESQRLVPSPSTPRPDHPGQACIMPVDRTRTVNSQGRQKSCAECAKSKRKCGLEQPNCIRCIRRHVSCIYPPQPRVQTAVPHGSTPDSDTSLEDAQTHVGIAEEENANLHFDFDMSAIATAATADFLDFDFPASTSCTNPLSAVLRQSPEAENQMILQTSHAQSKNSFSSAHLSSFAKARIGYGVEHMKLAPRMMVEQNCTPWMHPMLYEDHMPRSLEDAYATCALYIAKNQTKIGRAHV